MQPHEIVLWGATGFTGRLVADYLARHAPDGLDWAIAGRDRSRLEAVRQACESGPEVLVADALDPEAMAALVQRARVVVSTVGPFARYGTPLVEACATHGVDYCDITGETHWIRDNVDRFHDRATRSGARIVHCCGFDSIPSDLGVWMLHRHLQRQHQRSLTRANYYVARARGGFSGGTVTSLLDLLERASGDRELRRVLADPYALNPDGERSGPDRRDQTDARFDSEIGRWTAPFIMAAINTRIVRRTNALLDYPYGRDFRYNESILAGGSMKARLAGLGFRATMLGGFLAPTRWLMRRLLPSPGEGPSREKREAGCFEIRLLGRGDGEPGLRVRGRVRSDLDPGYGSTARMLAESALCLARDPLPERGGILTPASCMGDPLIERLRAAGMTFEVETLKS